ncbi:unnamed protein product [Rhizopus stolonifer]
MISLEEWEEKTKLSDNQKQTVHDLQEACMDSPLTLSSWYNPSPVPTRNLSTTDLLSSTRPVETLQLFYDWFATLEEEMDQEMSIEITCKKYKVIKTLAIFL